MNQITIQVRDRKKAKVLINFLETLDFIENITSSADIPDESESRDVSEEFFSFAGIWKNREMTLESLRKKAWPERS